MSARGVEAAKARPVLEIQLDRQPKKAPETVVPAPPRWRHVATYP
ncbi:hypothetical protein [Streptomyces sp. NPDC006645]